MVEGISHITFVVKDLDRMARILVEGLGAEEVYCSGDKTFSLSSEKFFMLGGVWIAVMQGAPLSERSYNHIAFKVADDALPGYAERLKALGLALREARPRVEGEGKSLYFYDDDNHLFELHSGTLAERLKRYAAQ